jgi:hypothetical protein
LELKYRSAHCLRGFSRRHYAGQRLAESADCSRMKLRYPRFVDADLGADLFHRGLLVIVEADDFLLARGQRLNRRADAIFGF